MGKNWRRKRKQNAYQKSKKEGRNGSEVVEGENDSVATYDNKPKKERPSESYVKAARENDSFETYYKAQKTVPEDEWSQFMECIKTDLPAAFRLTGTKSQSQALLNVIQENFFQPLVEQSEKLKQSGVEVGSRIFNAKPLPWYPNNFGWQLTLTRKDIQSQELFWKLHRLLISETETGNISRQETVSMIPPLLLDVRGHHKILDMCAAPGSKTAQIIEYLHNDSDNSPVEGFVIANDLGYRRCYMLTHQIKRLQSETLMVTNHDAAFMPNIFHTRKDGTVGPIKFDRILCDVPCSGDGTLRKNIDIWQKWNTGSGFELHGLQLRIARRGLEMLAVGGRMVYSTCSMNPTENEAVVNRLLTEFEGSISLVDVKGQLPGLKYTPGLTDWLLMDKKLEVLEKSQSLQDGQKKHLFPPTAEEAQNRHLNRCIRILPHHQDTGAFFVAVLEKNKPLPGEKIYAGALESNGSNDNDRRTQSVRSPPRKKFRYAGTLKEEPFYFFDKSNEFWPEIKDFYGVSNSFDMTLLLRRAEGGKGRTIYYTNAAIKDVIVNNQERIKIINAGLKVLARCDNLGSTCTFRLAQDGLRSLWPFLTCRKMSVKKNDLLLMLHCSGDASVPISTMHPETQKICEDFEGGSIAFVYKEDIGHAFSIEIAGWKGKTALRCYLCNNDKIHFIRLLGGDTSGFEKNKFKEIKLRSADWSSDNKLNEQEGPPDSPVKIE